MECDDSALSARCFSLEREIFEMLALANPRFIPTLLLVAQRIKFWTGPLLYRNLSIVGSDSEFEEAGAAIRIRCRDFIKLVKRKSASFFHDHVRRLALSYVDSDSTITILSNCSGVAHLAMFAMYPDPSYLPLIAAMPLLEISANIEGLFEHLNPDHPVFSPNIWVDFHHPLFRGLSHLDIFEVPVSASNEWADALCSLPHLTHVSFNHGPSLNRIPFRDMLTKCKSLQVLVLIFMGRDQFDMEVTDTAQRDCFAQDLRLIIVVMDDFLADWERGATGDETYWLRAEQFIRRRRSGDIEASEHILRLE
ncbi:hypothetical protein R3P38DRAFT_2905536 [Favolaschia claudopus]|uniref:Uncharacterized protein n=1 Tax=Favolaschia claudopus TaxID=2862362 RepID=A0AAW0CJS2_9AGAR